MYDLVITGGTLIDPEQGIHDRRDVAFTGGRVAAVAESIPQGDAARSINVAGKWVVPGLVDAHVHV
ncbi:MAG: amidohydrolase/deacetylase family metallohydrolase, partial [Chloroflexota bacterium]|nr:amidohydrolase/deacetylase family metallohydrolase [Chloroflexota bacterium]